MSVERVVFFLVLGYLWTPLRGGDVTVTCEYTASCLLPCPFEPGPEVVIHWLYTLEESTPVHTFYHNTDQLARQKPRYKGRTALFKDQIPKGNASLQLNSVQIADGGRYKCYTSTTNVNKEHFLNVQVQAPVGEVVLEQVTDKLICRSKDIYPEPAVTWSGLDGTDAQTSVSRAENTLYSISSSVRLSNSTAQEHSCKISTDYSWRRTTLKQRDPITASDSKTTLPCADSKTQIKSLIWKFNHTQTILTQTGSNSEINEPWRQFVEEVSESGSLTLKNLSSGHQGVYSCLLSSDRETHISSTEVRALPDPPSTAGHVVGVVLLVIILIILIVSALWWKRQKVLQRLREIKERLRVLEQENKRLKDHQQELEDLLPEIESCQTKPPLDGPKTEKPQTRGNQLTSELLSQVLQRLRKMKERLGEIKEEKKKLKKEKESLEALLLMKLFPEKDRSKDRPEKVEASAETLLNELTRGNQPPSDLSQVSKRLKEIKERLKEIKEENESLRANPVRELFSEKDRSPSDRPEMSADTQTGGNLPTSKLPSQVLQRLREVEQHLEKLKQEQRNLEEETQLLTGRYRNEPRPCA